MKAMNDTPHPTKGLDVTIIVTRVKPVDHPFHVKRGFDRISNLRSLRIGPIILWVAL